MAEPISKSKDISRNHGDRLNRVMASNPPGWCWPATLSDTWGAWWQRLSDGTQDEFYPVSVRLVR